MSFWNKLKIGVQIAKIGAKVAVNVLPAGKAVKIIGTITQGVDLGEQVVDSIKRGEK